MADNLRLRGGKVYAIRARELAGTGPVPRLQATHAGRLRRTPHARGRRAPQSATVMAAPAEL
jgi:hypothetical protein